VSPYPPYKAYKPAHMAWLDEVPAHWSVSSLRWLSARYTGGTPDRDNPEFWRDGSIPWLNSGAVNDPIILEPSAYISETGFVGSSAKWIPEGALVMALAGQGKTKGTVAQLGLSATCNQSMAALIPTKRVDARYLFWWLQSNYTNIRSMSGGDLRDGLNLQLLGDIAVPLPSQDEQRTIVSYLDGETAQIDDLIGKQKRLIELLAEKRQAIITTYVAHAVQPKAGDLGLRLKNVYSIVDERAKGADLPLMSVSIHRGLLRREETTDDEPRADDLSNYKVCRPGDIVLNRMRAFQGALGSSSEAGLVSPDYLVIRPHQWIEPGWLEMVLRSNWAIGEMQSRLRGIGSVDQGVIRTPRINAADLGEIRICVPQIIVQRKSLEEIRAVGERISLLSGKCAMTIRLLRERRSALISAAVTGKISVTNEGVAA
jgi:type I restriction enzyme S subunit